MDIVIRWTKCNLYDQEQLGPIPLSPQSILLLNSQMSLHTINITRIKEYNGFFLIKVPFWSSQLHKVHVYKMILIGMLLHVCICQLI